MITLLKRLIFCFAVFYSVNSHAWYNEAMCLLLKQEMQQYNSNKSSRAYRDAARNYSRNCGAAKKAQAIQQQKAQASVVTAQPVEVTPTVEPILDNTAVNNEATLIDPDTLQLTEQQKNDILQQLESPSQEIIIVQPSSQLHNDSLGEATTHTVTATVEPINVESVSVKNETKAAVEPEVTPKPKKVASPIIVTTPVEPAAQRSGLSALLFPSIALIFIVLLAVILLARLRKAKQEKAVQPALIIPAESTNNITADTVVDNSEAPAKTPTEFNEHNETENSISVDNTAEPLTTTPPESKPIATDSVDENDFTPEVTSHKVVEENTEEFTQAAKSTLARIKTANEYVEPEVRTFDPDAPLPGVKAEKPKAEKAQHTKPLNDSNMSEHVPAISKAPETSQTTPHKPDSLIPDVVVPISEQNTLSPGRGAEPDFKEPEVRTFDPDAPLPGQKKSAPHAVVVPHVNKDTESVAQAKPSVSAKQNTGNNSNPFANLSLDESWDPNSSVKPTIETKKQGPKSQALIEAEERAKNMQTKE
jgi:hypothetical protein